MSSHYEFPDDPEVFERVIEHSRQTSVDHWEARVAQYALEAKSQSTPSKWAQPVSESSKRKASRNAPATVKLT